MKKIITLMLAAIVAVLMLSSCASVAAPEHEAAPPAGAEASGFEISAERSSGIRLTSEEVAPTAASSGYTLTATLEPESSSADLLNWELSFVNPSSSWASGKSVGSYVTMTVSGFTATLSCKAAFGEPMTVTVSVKDNSEISASCRLEYTPRIAEFSIKIQLKGDISDSTYIIGNLLTPAVLVLNKENLKTSKISLLGRPSYKYIGTLQNTTTSMSAYFKGTDSGQEINLKTSITLYDFLITITGKSGSEAISLLNDYYQANIPSATMIFRYTTDQLTDEEIEVPIYVDVSNILN